MTTRTGPPRPPDEGRCTWVWHWEDVDIDCTENVIPGTRSCHEHFIVRCAPRRFPPRVVKVEDVTG